MCLLGLFYFLHEVPFKAVQVLGLDDALQIQAIFPVFFHLHTATLPHGSGKAQLVVGQQHPDGVHPVAEQLVQLLQQGVQPIAGLCTGEQDVRVKGQGCLLYTSDAADDA